MRKVSWMILAVAFAGSGILAAAAPQIGGGGGIGGSGAPGRVNRVPTPAPAPPAKPASCMARYTGPGNKPPQRLDDIFWENDRTAHRIYGPELATPRGENLTTSGIDVWVKKVRVPFMDKQLMTGQQHDDHGEGLDCYDVQQTTGCGGLGIWDDASKKLMRSGNWADKGGFVNGPDVASFWVTYAAWDAGGGRKVKEKRTFTLPAGTNFTRCVDTIDEVGGNSADLLVGVGIAKRTSDGTKFKGDGQWVTDRSRGILLYWEPEQFYKGASVGHTGCALLVDPASVVKFVTDDPNEDLVVVKVTPGKPWVYYLGACWSMGLDFHDEKDWEDYAVTYRANFDPAAK